MKMTFGRKFFAGLVALLMLGAIYFITLIIHKEAIGGTVMITFGIFVLTDTFMYIGGNVWNAWVKSKYFRSEMKAKVE